MSFKDFLKICDFSVVIFTVSVSLAKQSRIKCLLQRWELHLKIWILCCSGPGRRKIPVEIKGVVRGRQWNGQQVNNERKDRRCLWPSLRFILPAPDESNTWLPDSHAPCLNFPITHRPASWKSAPVLRVLTMLLGKWRPGGGGVQDRKEGTGNHAPGLSRKSRTELSRKYMDVLIDELLTAPFTL